MTPIEEKLAKDPALKARFDQVGRSMMPHNYAAKARTVQQYPDTPSNNPVNVVNVAEVVGNTQTAATAKEASTNPIAHSKQVSIVSNPSEVSGDQLLDDVREWLADFVAYPHEDALNAHVLWIAHCWLVKFLENTPRIAFLSPEPGSGKTRALEVTEPLLPVAVITVNATPSYVFRRIAVEDDSEYIPVLLFDEVDTIFATHATANNEELRGLINSGYRRGATAGRTVIHGKELSPEDWPSFAAVAMAGLNQLPDTLMTRSIVINMRRRRPDEKVKPYRCRVYAQRAESLRECLRQWTDAVRPAIENPAAYPELPDNVQDRDADVWEGLVMIADQAGGDWPKLARQAAQRMVADQHNRPETLGIKLLADIRKVFADRSALGTMDMLGLLHGIETSPWGNIKGEPIDSRFLARILDKYSIPTNKTIRIGSVTLKGYQRRDFYDAWSRYLPATSPEVGNTGNTGHKPATNTDAVTDVTEVTGLHGVKGENDDNGQLDF